MKAHITNPAIEALREVTLIKLEVKKAELEGTIKTLEEQGMDTSFFKGYLEGILKALKGVNYIEMYSPSDIEVYMY